MAEDVKFALFATGEDDKSPALFTRLAAAHVASLQSRLERDRKKPTSFIKAPARVRVVHFSVQQNEIFVKDLFFGQKASGPTRKFIPIGDVTDGLSSFISKSPDISIVDIYHAVRNAPRASVIDVSLYSHGFVEGPVLANTSDSQQSFPNGAPKRTATDRDGRVRSDFFPNMGEDPAGSGANALTQFAGGFATGAAFRIFGCNVQDIVPVGNERLYLRSLAFQTLREAFALQLTVTGPIRTALRRGRRPTQPVQLDMGREFDIEASLKKDPHISHTVGGQPLTSARLLTIHYSSDPLFQGETARVVSRNYVDVVKFAARQVAAGYAFAAAQALPNVVVFGALPGTGGSFDEGGSNRLMNVDRKVYGSYLRFYEKFVDIKLNEVGADRQRNYGIFDAETVAKVKTHLAET